MAIEDCDRTDHFTVVASLDLGPDNFPSFFLIRDSRIFCNGIFGDCLLGGVEDAWYCR